MTSLTKDKITHIVTVAAYVLMAIVLIVKVISMICPELTFSTDFDSFTDAADEGLGNVSDAVYKIAMTAGPLALLICLLIILFSHDSRKVSLIIGICVTIVLAWIAIMIVHSGWLTEFLKGIATKYFPGSDGG